MNAHLLAAASKVIPTPELLVNMVSQRVRQLSAGHRPLVQGKPGALASDIALTEIIDGKITWRPANPGDNVAEVLAFPSVRSIGKKAA
jgi:DNA-directed RNA polymerase subunit omega